MPRVLQLRSDPADAGRLSRVRDALLAARGGRVRPARDDKVVAAWNGLAISALAECGLLLARPDFTAAARDAAGLLAAVHLAGGRLVRTSRDGIAGGTAGALDDYACVAEGFLTLSGVTGEARWLQLAGELLEVALGSFGDGQGGFFDTAADDEALIFRPADPADNATPSGTFAVAAALLSYSALTGSARHREAAEASLGVLPGIAARYPRAAGTGLAVAEAWLAGPAEIAVVGRPDDERTRALHQTALHAAPPGAVLALGDGTARQASRRAAARRARAGGRRARRVRLPPVHLPGPGHHPGAAQGGARRSAGLTPPHRAVIRGDRWHLGRPATAPGTVSRSGYVGLDALARGRRTPSLATAPRSRPGTVGPAQAPGSRRGQPAGGGRGGDRGGAGHGGR